MPQGHWRAAQKKVPAITIWKPWLMMVRVISTAVLFDWYSLGEELGGCIGDGSGDINLDGCVQLNDLLDLFCPYGECGDGWALCPNILNDDEQWTSNPLHQLRPVRRRLDLLPTNGRGLEQRYGQLGGRHFGAFAVWDTFNPFPRLP